MTWLFGKTKKLEKRVILSEETLKELKSMLEKEVERKLFDMNTPGFRADHNYQETDMYKERIRIMKYLVELRSLYNIVETILKDYEKNNR